MQTAEVRDVRLSKGSKISIKAWEKRCRKRGIPLRSLFDDTVYSIESGCWCGPVPSYDFLDMKTYWEDAYHEFFSIPNEVKIEIDCFNTGIMSFDKGVYPKYKR